jgi:hypothetical protein
MTTTPGVPVTQPPESPRQAAVQRLRKRRELQTHVLTFVLVNAFLVTIWWLSTPDGFFWPVFPLFGWGIGVAFHAWDVLVGSEPSEEAIQAEMHRASKR